MLYRVLRNLSTGHVFGDIVPGSRFKPQILQKLIDANALCAISGPPLATLKGWARRAELLAPLGIITSTEFLDADNDKIRKAWGHKTTRAVEKAKGIIEEMLDARIVTNENSER